MRILIVASALVLASATGGSVQAEIKAPVQDGQIDVCLPKSLMARTDLSVKREVHVIVCFNIGTDGTPKDITIAHSGGSILDQEATNCVTQMHYKPATKDGQPMEFPLVRQMNWCATTNAKMPDCPPLPITPELRAICAKALHIEQPAQ
jgi:TonB family protein